MSFRPSTSWRSYCTVYPTVFYIAVAPCSTLTCRQTFQISTFWSRAYVFGKGATRGWGRLNLVMHLKTLQKSQKQFLKKNDQKDVPFLHFFKEKHSFQGLHLFLFYYYYFFFEKRTFWCEKKNSHLLTLKVYLLKLLFSFSLISLKSNFLEQKKVLFKFLMYKVKKKFRIAGAKCWQKSLSFRRKAHRPKDHSCPPVSGFECYLLEML